MKLPNKLFNYEESVLSKFEIVITEMLNHEQISVMDLFSNIKKDFCDITEYLEVLDCLYTLGKIDFDNETGRLYYVI